MSDEKVTDESGRFTVRPTSDSHFSWLRTRLAVERTIMAWVRTAVSLIGFGFTIVQFFDRLQQIPGTRPAAFPDAPRYLGMALISCGIGSLVVSLWQYDWTLRYLWSGDYSAIAGITKEAKQSPILAVIGVLLLVGVCALIAVVFRLI